MTNKHFVNACTNVAKQVLSAWCGDVNCYETTGKKQFCLTAGHSWGSGYCNWSWCRKDLFDALKEIGATNVAGEVKWNRIRIYFNNKKDVGDVND